MNTKTYTVISTCGDPHICSTLEDAITKRDAMMRGDLEAWKYFNPGEKMSASYHIVDRYFHTRRLCHGKAGRRSKHSRRDVRGLAGSVVNFWNLPGAPRNLHALGAVDTDVRPGKKKEKPTTREMTTPLLYLRAVELGLTIEDIDRLEIGFIYDLLSERANDDVAYDIIATQEDFDKF